MAKLKRLPEVEKFLPAKRLLFLAGSLAVGAACCTKWAIMESISPRVRTVQGQFATLWLEDDAGHRLTEPEEAIIKATPPPIVLPPDDSL